MTMEMSKRNEMFRLLCELSDQQFDPAAKRRLQAMIPKSNEKVKDELLGLIDDCVYASWSSDFEIKVLHYIWFSIGGSDEEFEERSQQLKNLNATSAKLLQEKYKWQFPR